MTKFTVEHDIPIPSKYCSKFVYPMDEMVVGDSIFTPIDPSDDNRHAIKGRIYNLVKVRNKVHPDHRFTVRSVEGGVRFWRIK